MDSSLNRPPFGHALRRCDMMTRDRLKGPTQIVTKGTMRHEGKRQPEPNIDSRTRSG
jgi:hypothetical protein